ncbi:hypothetical protein HYD65_04565 [Mycoplasmopsis bovis]|nr:hypothetical protein [Mycoplasmopsis bovis]MBT1316144.1 hypothetical protein [Mycoplasmopsis bovis]MBT1323076.1 hypothetical protein [Mycoplasmopsis bovis]MBT1363398.1 hypothetical protein [Mycoplasmopsis bovis]MBT1367735.1 hypothetical protein [Mycoplasmopsis bovis]MBT1369117.1 hypothetical protein [Mycoplasmopsis bovis]
MKLYSLCLVNLSQITLWLFTSNIKLFNVLSSLIKLPLRQWSKLTSDKAEYIKLRSKFFPKGNAIQKALDERKKLGK